MGIMEKTGYYKDLQRYYRARGEPTVQPFPKVIGNTCTYGELLSRGNTTVTY